jgi:hypothetical protein
MGIIFRAGNRFNRVIHFFCGRLGAGSGQQRKGRYYQQNTDGSGSHGFSS